MCLCGERTKNTGIDHTNCGPKTWKQLLSSCLIDQLILNQLASKKYIEGNDIKNVSQDDNPTPEINLTVSSHRQPRRNTGLSMRYQGHMYIQEGPQLNFTDSPRKELPSSIRKVVLKIVKPDNVPPGMRIFNSHFIDQMNHACTADAFEKSRFVVQAYKDDDKTLALTHSPMVQRVRQSLLLCLVAN